jgi:hypothetical protein
MGSIVAVVAALAVAFALPAGAVTGPNPAGPVTLSYSTPTTGLVAGVTPATETYSTSATAGTLNGAVISHICAHGANISNTTDFGYQGSFCVKQAGIASGGLTVGSDYQTQTVFSGTPSSGPLNFHVGEGTVTWIDDLSGVHTLTCGPGNPCDVVTEVNYSNSPAQSFFTQEMDFAGAPAAPTLNTATAGDTTVALGWTAGSDGGSPITNYQVNVSPSPSSGPCSTGSCLTGSTGTTFTVTGLTDFTPYSFTVQAVNAVNTGPISNSLSATPGPAGPTLNGTPGNGVENLTWTAVTGATNYRVTVNPHPGSGACSTGTCLTGNVTSFQVPGLSNGTPYTFTVAAQIGANFTAESNVVASTPSGDVIRQAITVTRPQGVLVISQYCSGMPTDINGNFDPSNNNGNNTPNLVPNTLCSLTLSGPRPDNLFNDAITAQPRSVTDAVTNGTTTVTSPSIAFTQNDVNQLVSGDGIPAGDRIQSVSNSQTALLTLPATTNFSGGNFSIVGSTVNFASAHAFTAGNEIEGLDIPGGTTIANVVSTTAVDISAPADAATTGMTVRIWTVAPTPAHLLTTGPHAGQYLQATGELRQVMIVDTRPSDPGWTATGQVSSFSNGTQTFSGDDLAWTPQQVHAFSAAFASPDGSYSMAPTAGASFPPGTPALGTLTSTSTDTSAPGTFGGATLAYANTGHGLGLAALDANLLLWIPVFNNAGTFSATLTLTAI